MYGNHWRVGAALAGLAALLCAASFGAYWGALYGFKQTQIEGRGDNPPGTLMRTRHSLQNAAGVPGLIKRAIANPIPQSRTDQEKRDLAAQEDMAVWAFWMTFAAFCTFFVTSAGTFLIWRQVELTRKAVEDTGHATLAMKRQNDLVEQGQRAWLAHDDITPTIIVGEAGPIGMLFQSIWKNVGAMPAFGCVFHNQHRIFSANGEPQPFSMGWPPATGVNIAPNQLRNSGNHAIEGVHFVKIARGESRLIFLIKVKYYLLGADENSQLSEKITQVAYEAFVVGEPSADGNHPIEFRPFGDYSVMT